MALLESRAFKAGFKAPNFKLKSVEGVEYSLSSFHSSKILVILFICNHCPYVKAIEDRYLSLERQFRGHGVQFVGICSNDPTDYPDDAPSSLLKRWREKHYEFPYLIDDTQQAAKDYGAVCTPDIYVFDHDRSLAYHGRLDDHWESAQKVTQKDLEKALHALVSGKTPSAVQLPSMGCSIKWRC